MVNLGGLLRPKHWLRNHHDINELREVHFFLWIIQVRAWAEGMDHHGCVVVYFRLLHYAWFSPDQFAYGRMLSGSPCRSWWLCQGNGVDSGKQQHGLAVPVRDRLRSKTANTTVPMRNSMQTGRSTIHITYI